jgi:hypothetical protein
MSPVMSLPPTTPPPVARNMPATATSGSAATRTTALTQNLTGIRTWQSTPNLADSSCPQLGRAGSSNALPPAYGDLPPSCREGAKANLPPSYWQYPEDDHRRSALQITPGQPLPTIGSVASRALSRDLAAGGRGQAVKHRERIGDQYHELQKIAKALRTAAPTLPAESTDFSPLADGLMDLRNAWSQGTLAGSSRFLKIGHSEANKTRTELETQVKNATCELAGHIYVHAPGLARQVMDVGQTALGRIGSTRYIG